MYLLGKQISAFKTFGSLFMICLVLASLRKKLRKGDKEMPLQAPLPKQVQDKIQRTVVYDLTKKEVTKWEPAVKRNREAPTIYFYENTHLGFSTVGAIASEFKPRTDFEKKMASLVHFDEAMEAERKDGARLLEFNKVTTEEVKDSENRRAKMRNLFSRHEMKAKHAKRGKSKVVHRSKKRDRLKAVVLDMQTDPEALKELARKQEHRRAEERMTQKHKVNKFGKRIVSRGLDVQDEGTRAAFQEQLHLHQLLKRKQNTMKDTSSSSEGSSDEGDDDLDGSDMEDVSKLLEKAMEKTKSSMDDDDDDDEVSKSSLLKLPFMVRGLAKKKEAADEEAKLALQEYEALKNKVDKTGVSQGSIASGRRVFGATQKNHGREIKAGCIPEIRNPRSGSEDEHDSDEDLQAGRMGKKELPEADVNVDLTLLREDLETADDSLFKEADENPDGNSDSESEAQMIDGILSSETVEKYKLPSQEELIRRAFAGDDVEDEFANEENRKPEAPSAMPGWGQWASVKGRKGLPSRMKEDHENALKKRQEALKTRKDAKLMHVIISEKVDKKAEKLHTNTLPYPFTSQEVFEQSIRMPIGPEFNPAMAFRAISRPEVVKTSGVIIKPISFDEVNQHERAADDQKQKAKAKVGANKKSRSSAKSK